MHLREGFISQKFTWKLIFSVVGIVCVTFAGAQTPTPALAPGLPWVPGALLSAATNPTTGTLTLRAKSMEREYTIENTNVTLVVKLLRLSGERELPLRTVDLGPTRNVFEGSTGRVTFKTTGPETGTIEYETLGDTEGLAVAELRSSSKDTSPTLNQSMGIRLIDKHQAVNVTVEGVDRTFREQITGGYKVVAPLSKDQKVTMKITTAPFEGQVVRERPVLPPIVAPTLVAPSPAAPEASGVSTSAATTAAPDSAAATPMNATMPAVAPAAAAQPAGPSRRNQAESPAAAQR